MIIRQSDENMLIEQFNKFPQTVKTKYPSTSFIFTGVLPYRCNQKKDSIQMSTNIKQLNRMQCTNSMKILQQQF